MSRWEGPQQGTSMVSAEVASRVGENTQGGWTPVIAQNLPTAQTQIKSPRQSPKRHRAGRIILTSSSYIRQGPWILAPVLPLTFYHLLPWTPGEVTSLLWASVSAPVKLMEQD